MTAYYFLILNRFRHIPSSVSTVSSEHQCIFNLITLYRENVQNWIYLRTCS